MIMSRKTERRVWLAAMLIWLLLTLYCAIHVFPVLALTFSICFFITTLMCEQAFTDEPIEGNQNGCQE